MSVPGHQTVLSVHVARTLTAKKRQQRNKEENEETQDVGATMKKIQKLQRTSYYNSHLHIRKIKQLLLQKQKHFIVCYIYD